MTKQEEIRRGILGIHSCHYSKEPNELTNAILLYLVAQGVVLKAERELPRVRQGFGVTLREIARQSEAQNDMLKAGYVAVEPLIGEKDEGCVQ